MTRIVVAVAFVVCACVVANADEPPALPKDVPPVVGTAVAIPPTPSDGDKWSIKLSVPKVRWEVVGEERPKIDWPEFKTNVEDASLTLSMAYGPESQLNEIAQNRILDMKGKRLHREEALKRLASSTPVLVSVSGRRPDPFYLQTTKPDTLVVVLGIPSSPAPELLPQPASRP
jgi:hypothetical protein